MFIWVFLICVCLQLISHVWCTSEHQQGIPAIVEDSKSVKGIEIEKDYEASFLNNTTGSIGTEGESYNDDHMLVSASLNGTRSEPAVNITTILRPDSGPKIEERLFNLLLGGGNNPLGGTIPNRGGFVGGFLQQPNPVLQQVPYQGYPLPYPGYQQPNPGYQQPYPGYQQPYPGYQQPNPGYQQPYPGYQQNPYAVQPTGNYYYRRQSNHAMEQIHKDNLFSFTHDRSTRGRVLPNPFSYFWQYLFGSGRK